MVEDEGVCWSLRRSLQPTQSFFTSSLLQVILSWFLAFFFPVLLFYLIFDILRQSGLYGMTLLSYPSQPPSTRLGRNSSEPPNTITYKLENSKRISSKTLKSTIWIVQREVQVVMESWTARVLLLPSSFHPTLKSIVLKILQDLKMFQKRTTEMSLNRSDPSKSDRQTQQKLPWLDPSYTERTFFFFFSPIPLNLKRINTCYIDLQFWIRFPHSLLPFSPSNKPWFLSRSRPSFAFSPWVSLQFQLTLMTSRSKDKLQTPSTLEMNWFKPPLGTSPNSFCPSPRKKLKDWLEISNFWLPLDFPKASWKMTNILSSSLLGSKPILDKLDSESTSSWWVSQRKMRCRSILGRHWEEDYLLKICDETRSSWCSLPSCLQISSVYLPFVDALKDGKTIFSKQIQIYGNQLLPTVVSSLIYLNNQQVATFDPPHAVSFPRKPFVKSLLSERVELYLTSIKSSFLHGASQAYKSIGNDGEVAVTISQGLDNPIDGPGLLIPRIQGHWESKKSSTIPAKTFHAIAGYPFTKAGIFDGLCGVNTFYYNESFADPSFVQGTVQIYHPILSEPTTFKKALGYTVTAEWRAEGPGKPCRKFAWVKKALPFRQ